MIDGFEHFDKEEIQELLKVFHAQATEIVEEVLDAILKLEEDPSDGQTFRLLQRHIHTLKGDSNSVGLGNIGAICHRMEDVLGAMKAGRLDMNREAVGALLGAMDAIQGILNRARDSEEGAEEPLEGALADLDRLLENEQSSAPEDPLRKEGMEEDSALAISLQRKGGGAHDLSGSSSAHRHYEAGIVFHPLCAEKAIGAFMVIQKIEQAGRLLSTDPPLEGNQIEGVSSFRAEFESDLSPEELRPMLSIAGITSDVELRVKGGEPESVASEEAPAGDADGEKDRRGGSEDVMAAAAKTTETIRVESNRVDRLMNLVGELIIGRSIIEHIARDVEEGSAGDDLDDRLFTVNSYLERTVSDLQKGIMRMRMVAINQTFRKFPKLVRDLTAGGEKKVSLSIEGRETELDKGIVDSLGEPLAHIVRNMVDHGIEKPEERVAAGKPEEGRIVLRAYHEAAQIVIEAEDDGRGIDGDRLRKKAVEAGHLAKEEADRLSPMEARELIFVPGLSTSEKLSETSGRGVGMDAVKSVIEGMKGSIEVGSEPGRGSRFKLRLPLTLAIIRALLVEVGTRLYAVPIAAVQEVTRSWEGDLITIDGSETLRLRDQIVSIVRLSDLFGIPSLGRERKFVLVIGAGGRRVGLLVDTLVGQQELVVKAVDENYSGTDLVSGASILGDGRVILILDALAVIRKSVDATRQRMSL